ncbi:MAG: bifunctional glutamate N-acetyltransferase/amino-acid acetyltransferase ArgJ [Clostridia bacterium]|nr:bifunctional glutamate N-acetyltransferase/amino-acid acetyltransferase ArgJ [Clostridia bacterium]
MSIIIKPCDGGITAPAGFRASGIHCGLRKNAERRDIALIVADKTCSAAGVYTTNKVFAAPVGVTRAHLAGGKARAVICNSGNANACNADGYDKANATCKALAEELGIAEEEVIVASTGVIGVPLPLEPILTGIPKLHAELDITAEASDLAATAIMTTDLKKKEYCFSYEFNGTTIKMGGICKGSGMIHPQMGTMLGFITTDAAISAELLDRALKAAIADTFNMVSVDGDTSTNDMVTVLASGLSGAAEITGEGEAYDAFCAALNTLCRTMAMAIAADGEGATKLLECNLYNFSDIAGAKTLAKSVICSSLVKCAMFGADANWGRILCALGYAGVPFDTDLVDVRFKSKAGEILVCENGKGHPFDEDIAKSILVEDVIQIEINMKCGNVNATAWGCDFSYDYVRINGDYRS